MRTVINIILAACAVVLVYMSYRSIMGPIEFDQEKNYRDAQVIQRLKDIRSAQEAYRVVNNGKYAGSFDELINFVENEKVPMVIKEGTLSDEQFEKGVTSDAKAMEIINKAKKTNDWRKVKELGLENFKRDTTWINVKDTIFKRAGFVADSMRYVPFGNGVKFTIDTATQISKSGAPIYLFEVKVPFDVYLNGLDKQEIINLNDEAGKMERYAGLQVGSIEVANNNAGNWE